MSFLDKVAEGVPSPGAARHELLQQGPWLGGWVGLCSSPGGLIFLVLRLGSQVYEELPWEKILGRPAAIHRASTL